jgi:hypothetical protein
MKTPNSLRAVLLMCLISSPAWADPISPGFDLFETPAGSSSVDLTGMGLGVIPLEGYRPPVSALFSPPWNNPAVNDTDTIVQRLAGISPLPVGGSGTIPIELVALSLQSVAPVNIGGNFYDLTVLGGSLLTPSDPSPVGNMIVNHTISNGGTFNATLPVHATLTFTQVGNPLNTFSQPFADIFSSTSVWSHTPRPDDMHAPPFAAAGNFYPGVNPGTGPSDPSTGQKVLTTEESLLAKHGVLPAQITSDVVRVVDPITGQSHDTPVPEDGTAQFLGPPDFFVPINAPNQWILFKEPDGRDSDRLSIRGGLLYFESDPLGPLFGDLPPNPVATLVETGNFQLVSPYFQGGSGLSPQVFVLSDLNVPEPTSLALVMVGAIGGMLLVRRRRRT